MPFSIIDPSFLFWSNQFLSTSSLLFLQDFMNLSKEVTSLQDTLGEREDEVHELKAERNNTRVSVTCVLWLR